MNAFFFMRTIGQQFGIDLIKPVRENSLANSCKAVRYMVWEMERDIETEILGLQGYSNLK